MKSVIIMTMFLSVSAQALTQEELERDVSEINGKKQEEETTRPNKTFCGDKWVVGSSCTLCPDGKWYGGKKCVLLPDGKYGAE